MNAVAITTPDPAFHGWLQTGRDLLHQRTDIEWRLADWLATGREQYVDQAGFDFLADQLGIAPKSLKAAAKVAAVFPPHLRAAGLTFEHHESVANLPQPDALAVLRDAETHGWDDRETRVQAVKRRAEITPSMFEDDDWEHHELVAIQRAWNRARPSVRADFLEIAAEAELGVIDA